ncbi:TIC236 [Scenedesmus sp. PABB004]|nr:TIC236 [Scenedesmus sp. PABB004]
MPHCSALPGAPWVPARALPRGRLTARPSGTSWPGGRLARRCRPEVTVRAVPPPPEGDGPQPEAGAVGGGPPDWQEPPPQQQHQQQQQQAAPQPASLPQPGASTDAPHDAASASALAAAGRLAPPGAERGLPPFSLGAAIAPLGALLLGVAALLQAWLRRWLVRAGVATGVGLLALHLLINRVALPLVNARLLPGLLDEAQQLTLREVRLGGVSSVSLPGLLGLGPLVTLRDLAVGPGPVERSSAEVPEVTLSVLPGASLAARQVQLQVALASPRVRAVQGSNFSWLGYPADTTPSSRDLLPGLTQRAAAEQAAALQAPSEEGDWGPTDSGSDGGEAWPPAAAGAGPGSSRGSSVSSASGATSSRAAAAWGPQAVQPGSPRPPPFASLSAAGGAGRDGQTPQQQQQAAAREALLQQLQERRASHGHASSSSGSDEGGGRRHSRAPRRKNGGGQAATQRGQPPASETAEQSDTAGTGDAAPSVQLSRQGPPGDPLGGEGGAASSDELAGQAAAASGSSAGAEPTYSDEGGEGSSSDGGSSQLTSDELESSTGATSGSGSAGDASERVEAVPALPPQQQQAAVAGGLLSSARQWLLGHCQSAAGALLRAGGSVLRHAASQLGSRLQLRVSLPPPALRSVTIRDGELDVAVWGEPLPRQVSGVRMALTLGRDYETLDIAVEGDAAPRHPASVKCTTIDPAAKRHLRHVTPGAAGPQAGRLRRFACDVLPVPDAPADPAAPQQQEPERQPLPLSQQQEQLLQQPELQRQLDGAGAAAAGGGQHGQAALPPAQAAGVPPPSPGSQLPLATLHLPSGQLAVPSHVHFLLPEEFEGRELELAPFADGAPRQTGGGHLSVRVLHRWARPGEGRDALTLTVAGRSLGAPLIERLLELPMDISSGVVDGNITVAAHDDATWEFPAITGKLAARGVDLHFWDAPDDILGADMELLFERDHVYLHNAVGAYGAIPLRVSGDLDLCPVSGQYRLQAAAGPAEVNAARASLGVRPLPFPVAGAARGVLAVTGPLERPIFSGSAAAVRPPPALLVGVEATPALDVLLAHPGAVAVADRLPASAASGVFTLDTATQMFVLHSAQAVPSGGGLLQAAGKMWVAPAAEADPRAIAMEAGGSGLSAAGLAAGYLGLDPGGAGGGGAGGGGPAAVLAGAGPVNMRGSLTGSHLAPTTRVEWAAPASGLSGSASVSPTAVTAAAAGPAFSLRASAATSTPNAERARAANTQAEATYYGLPRVEGFSLEGRCSGVDLMHLAPPSATHHHHRRRAAPGAPGAPPPPLGGGGDSAPPALVDGSPVRLRMAGALKLSGTRDDAPAARRQAGLAGDGGYLFTGPLTLEGLRLNQLSLARALSGDVVLTGPRLLLRGRGPGRGGEELLELDLALPPPHPGAAALGPGPDGVLVPQLYFPPGFDPPPAGAPRGAAGALPAGAGASHGGAASAAAAGDSAAAQGEGGGGGGGGEGGDGAEPPLGAAWGAGGDAGAAARSAAAAAEAAAAAAAADAQRVSHVLLRRGDLHISSTVNASGTAFGAAVEHLPLDELELGSLRGQLVSGVLDVDLAAAAGRLSAALASPRFSGLAGTSLSAHARWERDIVQLERATLTQPGSRYELAAEYVLPPGFVLPASLAQAQAAAAADAPEPRAAAAGGHHHGGHHHHGHGHGHHGHRHHRRHAGGRDGAAGAAQEEEQAPPAPASAEGGRWRLELVVPHAAVEELLPAGQLLRRAGATAGRDYGEAKASFLAGLSRAGILAAGDEFAAQVAALAEAAAAAAAAAAATSGGAAPAGITGGAAGSSLPSLPGLQELRGTWSGKLSAVGGGGAGARLEYDLTGGAWRAGPYTLDQLLLRGSADGSEGINLEELRLVVGGATLHARGCLLGQAQDASFALTDFPAVLLQPLFAALPALQHAAPALDARAAAGGRPPHERGMGGLLLPGSTALSGLGARLEARLAGLGLKLPSPAAREQADPLEPFLSSPVSGLLNVRGALGGSASAPTGVISLRLLDGALGRQRLARATASLALNSAQQLAMDVELAPADSHGHIRLAGSVDLLGDSAAASADAAAAAATAGGEAPAAASGDTPAPEPPEPAAGSAADGEAGGAGGGSGASGSKGGRAGRKAQRAAQRAAQAAEQAAARAAEQAGGAAAAPASPPGGGSEPQLELALSVKDGGMALLAGLAPGVTWGGGGASVSLAATGPAAAPLLTGRAAFSKGSLSTAALRHPLTQLSGSLALDGERLTVSGLEARSGPKGTISLAGGLPLRVAPAPAPAGGGAGEAAGLSLAVSGLELRVRGLYSGSLDAALALRGGLDAPALGGSVSLSRGTVYLVPPAGGAGPDVPAPAAPAGASQAELVRTAFAALKAGRARAALEPHYHAPGGGGAGAAAAAGGAGAPPPFLLPAPGGAGAPRVVLAGLEVVLGPELRAVFPVVLNVGVSGRLSLSGDPTSPAGLRPAGVLRLEGGVLNLVATQFRLEREAPNALTFTPEGGLGDPVVEVALASSELRAAISGRASAWQEHLTLTATGAGGAVGGAGAGGVAGGAGVGGGGGAGGREGALEGLAGDALGGRAVARVFEGRLSEALLGEDGSLSLGVLAGNTLGSLLPKIETQGQLGAARWRLVSAPSLPGLLSSADPQASGAKGGAGDSGARLLRSLALGTEVELALGRRLVAALSHNMPAAPSDGGEPGTEVRLSLALSRQLRLLVQQRGLRLQPSVLLQFNSDGRALARAGARAPGAAAAADPRVGGMAMFKGLLGGAAGAAAYTAYRDSDAILSSKDLASGLYDYWAKKGASNLAEVSRLQRNVDDLQNALLKTLHDRQQPTVIVAGGNGKSGLGTAGGVVLVAGGVALYLRYVKGWRLADLMYVTRASLQSVSESMKQGMDTVRAQFEARAADLLERMAVLGGKQEELLEAQGALGSELALVGGKVGLVSEQVGFSNHAILMLCGALSEMAKRVGISNGKYVRELEHLSRTVATTSGLPAGVPGAAVLPLPVVGMEPFHAPPALLPQPAASMPPGGGGGGHVNPAVYSLSGGADGARTSAGGGAFGVRGLSEPQVLAGGSSDPWGTQGRAAVTKPAWTSAAGRPPTPSPPPACRKHLRLAPARPATMAFTCSDICKMICAVFLPPLGVFLEVGCGRDLCINILLTLLIWIPGVIHAFYIILKH